MRLQVAFSLSWTSSFAFGVLAQQTNATSAIHQALSAVLPSCAVCDDIICITILQHELIVSISLDELHDERTSPVDVLTDR